MGKSKKENERMKEKKDGKHEIWESSGRKEVFLLLIHKYSAEQGKKSPLKSGNISHTNLQVLTRQLYTLHLHIDEEKVKTTNQLQK